MLYRCFGTKIKVTKESREKGNVYRKFKIDMSNGMT